MMRTPRARQPGPGALMDPADLDDPEDQRPRGRLGKYRAILSLSDGWIFLVLIFLVVLFTILSGDFLTTFNLVNILASAAIIAVMAVGQTFVIITGGIDLSVGSVLVLSGVIAAEVMTGIGGKNPSGPIILLACLAGVASGGALGLINGWLIARLKIPALIVTLGAYGVALGFAQVITGGIDLHNIPQGFINALGYGRWLGIPVIVYIALFAALILGLVLAQTRFGQHTYAIGSNQQGARRAGIKVNRTLIEIYTMQGLLSGVAGIMSLAYFSTTTIAGHTTDNLAVISGVVLGGTSLFGGYGTIAGTLIGILIPVVLQNGLVILAIQSYWQTIVTGMILVLAVYADQLKRRSRQRN